MGAPVAGLCSRTKGNKGVEAFFVAPGNSLVFHLTSCLPGYVACGSSVGWERLVSSCDDVDQADGSGV